MPRNKRPAPGGGARHSGGGGLAAILGASLGGQDANPDYLNPGAHDFKDSSFDANTQQPFAKQNFWSRLRGSPDLNTTYRLSQLQGDLDVKKQTEVERIKNGYDVAMEGLRHSNLTKTQQDKLAGDLKVQRENHIQAVMAKSGVAPTEAAQQVFTDTQAPMVPSLTKTAGEADIAGNRAITAEKSAFADTLGTPAGSAAYNKGLFDKFSAGGYENKLKDAQSKRLGVMELGPGSYATSIDALNGPGVGLFNQPHMAPTIDIGTGKIIPASPGGPRMTIGGEFYHVVPLQGGGGKLPDAAPAAAPGMQPSMQPYGPPAPDPQNPMGLPTAGELLQRILKKAVSGGLDNYSDFMMPSY